MFVYLHVCVGCLCLHLRQWVRAGVQIFSVSLIHISPHPSVLPLGIIQVPLWVVTWIHFTSSECVWSWEHLCECVWLCDSDCVILHLCVCVNLLRITNLSHRVPQSDRSELSSSLTPEEKSAPQEQVWYNNQFGIILALLWVVIFNRWVKWTHLSLSPFRH